MVNTRKGVNQEDVDQHIVVNFLKSDQFRRIVEEIVSSEVKPLIQKINSLENVIKRMTTVNHDLLQNNHDTTENAEMNLEDDELNSSNSSAISTDTVVEQKTGTRQTDSTWKKRRKHRNRNKNMSTNFTSRTNDFESSQKHSAGNQEI
nr:unnamed protein product [Callosobruchus analis]